MLMEVKKVGKSETIENISYYSDGKEYTRKCK